MAKMNVNSLITKDYRKNYVFAAQKTNPIQTQFPKGQNERKIACQKIRPHPCYLTCSLEIARTLDLRYNNLQSQTMLKQRKNANWLNKRSVLSIL